MTTTIDRDLFDHWRSVTDDSEALIFADRLQEHGQHERAELVRVSCDPALRQPCALKYFTDQVVEELRSKMSRLERGGDYNVLMQKAHPIALKRLDARLDRCTRLTARRRELEARLSVWPCKRCRGKGGRWAKTDGGYDSERLDCPACGGSGDLLKVDSGNPYEDRTGPHFVQLHIDWRAGYPYAATLLTLADAVEEEDVAVWCEQCAKTWKERRDGSWVKVRECATCNGTNRKFIRRWQPTPRLRALCDPERPPPWGVSLEAVMVEDREPAQYLGGYLWCCELPSGAGGDRHELPPPVFLKLVGYTRRENEGGDAPWRDCKVYESADAAKLALGVGIVAFGKGK